MRSERLCGLGRNLRNRSADAGQTYAAQWFERTLDDSAVRRIYIPESFLGADACLLLLLNVTNGLVVYPALITKRLEEGGPASIQIVQYASVLMMDRNAVHGYREYHDGPRKER